MMKREVCNIPEEIRGYSGTIGYAPGANASLVDLEKQHIINTLSKMSGNNTRVAETLGVSIKTYIINYNLTTFLTKDTFVNTTWQACNIYMVLSF